MYALSSLTWGNPRVWELLRGNPFPSLMTSLLQADTGVCVKALVLMGDLASGDTLVYTNQTEAAGEGAPAIKSATISSDLCGAALQAASACVSNGDSVEKVRCVSVIKESACLLGVSRVTYVDVPLSPHWQALESMAALVPSCSHVFYDYSEGVARKPVPKPALQALLSRGQVHHCFCACMFVAEPSQLLSSCA